MTLEIRENQPTAACPVCEAAVSAPADVEESEILYCQDCQTMLVVESVSPDRLVLEEAPEMEEDWGE
jgi:alpha-aminoadipate/glutamate carrier protein LysW